MKKLTTKKAAVTILTPLSAVASVFALGTPGAHAQTTPVFNYEFPASWNGTGSTVTDQSTAGNNGTTVSTPTLSASLPAGGSGNSLTTTGGGIETSADASLNNAAVAAAGGFTFDVSFEWNGTTTSSYNYTQKILDYAGTESLQLLTTNNGTASLQMVLNANNGLAGGPETVATSMTIDENVWYNVVVSFDTAGNSVDGNGDLAGIVYMDVDGNMISGAAIKGTYGDDLDRPIGVGQLAYPGLDLVGFKGNLYDPSVELGAVETPEPSSLALMGVFGGLGAAWKLRRRNRKS